MGGKCLFCNLRVDCRCKISRIEIYENVFCYLPKGRPFVLRGRWVMIRNLWTDVVHLHVQISSCRVLCMHAVRSRQERCSSQSRLRRLAKFGVFAFVPSDTFINQLEFYSTLANYDDNDDGDFGGLGNKAMILFWKLLQQATSINHYHKALEPEPQRIL